MNKYTFKFGISPSVAVEYEIALPPFQGSVREAVLALKTSADECDEPQLREQAKQAAHNFARSLSYELGERFEVEYQGRDVLYHTGQQSVAFCLKITVKAAPVETSNTTDLERGRQDAQRRIVERTRREAIDVNLRDM